MNSNMVKPGKFDHLHLLYNFTVLLRIAFHTPNTGVWNQLHKTLSLDITLGWVFIEIPRNLKDRRKDGRNDGQKDGQTLFCRTLPTQAGGPINLVSTSLYFKLKRNVIDCSSNFQIIVDKLLLSWVWNISWYRVSFI